MSNIVIVQIIFFSVAASKTHSKRLIYYRNEFRFLSASAKVGMETSFDVRGHQSLMTRVTLTHDLPAFKVKDTVSATVKFGGRNRDSSRSGLLQT